MARATYSSYLPPKIGAKRTSTGSIANYDQFGNVIMGYDPSGLILIKGPDGTATPSPNSRNIGATPMAQPQANKGAITAPTFMGQNQRPQLASATPASAAFAPRPQAPTAGADAASTVAGVTATAPTPASPPRAPDAPIYTRAQLGQPQVGKVIDRSPAPPAVLPVKADDQGNRSIAIDPKYGGGVATSRQGWMGDDTRGTKYIGDESGDRTASFMDPQATVARNTPTSPQSAGQYDNLPPAPPPRVAKAALVAPAPVAVTPSTPAVSQAATGIKGAGQNIVAGIEDSTNYVANRTVVPVANFMSQLVGGKGVAPVPEGTASYAPPAPPVPSSPNGGSMAYGGASFTVPQNIDAQPAAPGTYVSKAQPNPDARMARNTQMNPDATAASPTTTPAVQTNTTGATSFDPTQYQQAAKKKKDDEDTAALGAANSYLGIN